MISLGLKSDIEEIMQLIQSAIIKMDNNNINQWDDVYPNKKVIENDIQSKCLYKYIIGTDIAGIVVLNNQGSPEYNEIDWTDKTDNYLVIHRLTIHSKYQGKGISKELLEYCENIAKKKKKSSIRLDVFAQNHIAINLYTKKKYLKKGIVKFRKGAFYCFEKLMFY